MFMCTFAFANGMAPVRVRHQLKLHIVSNKLIDQDFCILVMYVVVAGPMDIEEISSDIFNVF